MRVAPTASVAAVLIAGLVTVAASLVPFLQHHRPSEVDAILDAPLLPAAATRLLSFGFRSAIADITYLQAIQVVATPARHEFPQEEIARRGLATYRLLEYTTNLDPLFSYAYVFGANSIPSERLDGTADNAEEAARLLEKGMREAKPDWRIPFNLAFLRSAYLGDFSGAAEAMSQAAALEGRPSYLPLLATRLAAQGGAVETGLALAAAMRDNATDEQQREMFDTRLRLLELERDLRIIETAAERFIARNGYRPGSLQTLLASRDLKQVPIEPFGGRYYYDALTGQARSTAKGRMRVFLNEADTGPTVDDEKAPQGIARDDLPVGSDSLSNSASIGTGKP